MDTLDALKVAHEIVDEIIQRNSLKEPVITGTARAMANLIVLGFAERKVRFIEEEK